MVTKDYDGHEVAVMFENMSGQYVVEIDGKRVGRAYTVDGVKQIIEKSLFSQNRANKIPIGQAMREARTVKGYSITELAEKSNVAAQNISAYEQGTRNPSLYLVADLADALGISIDEYIGRGKK